MNARLFVLLLVVSALCAQPEPGAGSGYVGGAAGTFAEALSARGATRRRVRFWRRGWKRARPRLHRTTPRRSGPWGRTTKGLEALEELLGRSSRGPVFPLRQRHAARRSGAATKKPKTPFREATQQQPDLWANLLAWGDLMQQTGRVRRGAAALRGHLPAASGGGVPDVRLRSVSPGQAAAELAEFRDANDAFRTAYRLDGDGRPEPAPLGRPLPQAVQRRRRRADLRRGPRCQPAPRRFARRAGAIRAGVWTSGGVGRAALWTSTRTAPRRSTSWPNSASWTASTTKPNKRRERALEVNPSVGVVAGAPGLGLLPRRRHGALCADRAAGAGRQPAARAISTSPSPTTSCAASATRMLSASLAWPSGWTGATRTSTPPSAWRSSASGRRSRRGATSKPPSTPTPTTSSSVTR